MAIFVSDSFTDTDSTALQSHTGETGATWTKHASGLGADAIINNNQLAFTDAAGAEYYASGTPASAEYDVEADVVVVDTTRDSAVGVLGRVDTSALTWYLADHVGSLNQWRLFRRVNGSFTSLGSFSQDLTNATTYELKLEIRDAAKKLYVDGVERISNADDNVKPAGRAGVRLDSTPGNTDGMRLDDFVATDLSVGGGDFTPRMSLLGVG